MKPHILYQKHKMIHINFGKRSLRNSKNSLLIQTCFLLYITSFSSSRSFKDLLFRGLGEDFFLRGIMSDQSYWVNWIFLSKITNVGFHGKPLIFLNFWDLVFMDYSLNFGWYSQKCWQKNLKLWWYS